VHSEFDSTQREALVLGHRHELLADALGGCVVDRARNGAAGLGGIPAVADCGADATHDESLLEALVLLVVISLRLLSPQHV
jgi:hypothetical protein